MKGRFRSPGDRGAVVLALLSLVLAAVSCAPRVARLDLGDRRLPAEARRWLADAEDEVAITRAERDEAADRLEQAEAFRRYVERDVSPRWPSSAPAAQARERLGRLARERIALARLELRVATLQSEVARARLQQTRAETAVRHDLRAYNLESIRQVTDAARASLSREVQQVEVQRAQVDQVTTEFWQAYGAFARSGGRNDVLWGWQD